MLNKSFIHFCRLGTPDQNDIVLYHILILLKNYNSWCCFLFRSPEQTKFPHIHFLISLTALDRQSSLTLDPGNRESSPLSVLSRLCNTSTYIPLSLIVFVSLLAQFTPVVYWCNKYKTATFCWKPVVHQNLWHHAEKAERYSHATWTMISCVTLNNPLTSMLYFPVSFLVSGTFESISCPSFFHVTEGAGFPCTEQ